MAGIQSVGIQSVGLKPAVYNNSNGNKKYFSQSERTKREEGEPPGRTCHGATNFSVIPSPPYSKVCNEYG